ncbi:MAG: topoisomerase [Pirellula sp.]|nr:topoisomerase [Pirellula sp.]
MPDESPSGCLGMILGLLGIRPTSARLAVPKELPFRRRDDFLSPAERSLFGVLCHVLGSNAVICPKVRVADLIFVVDRRSNQGHANKIDRKHVDFVICTTDTVTPRVIIELDDSSHSRADRAERDEFVDAAFQAAGLPVVRIPARHQYQPAEIAALILPHCTDQKAAEPQPPAPMFSSAVHCPNCGNVMVLRTAGQGARAGERFYGCKSYPKCRTILPCAE